MGPYGRECSAVGVMTSSQEWRGHVKTFENPSNRSFSHKFHSTYITDTSDHRAVCALSGNISILAVELQTDQIFTRKRQKCPTTVSFIVCYFVLLFSPKAQ